MAAIRSFILACFFLFANAIPSALVKRNPCDGIGTAPRLYHEYREENCPARFKIDQSGRCKGYDDKDQFCAVFCQIRTTFRHDKEFPIVDSYCHGPGPCSVQAGRTAIVSIGPNVDAKFLPELPHAISGGFIAPDGLAQSAAKTVTLGKDECGYFTIVPIRQETCGTHTRMRHTGINTCEGDVENTSNVCARQPRLIRNNDPRGPWVDSETIFVKVNCADNQPLGPDKQDPIYRNDGVPYNPKDVAAAIATVQRHQCNVDYKFVLNSFEIKGRAWNENQLGKSGAKLKKEIGGCGAIAKWKFDYYDENSQWDWHASGTLPIGTGNCVERALKTTSGISDLEGCSGSG